MPVNQWVKKKKKREELVVGVLDPDCSEELGFLLCNGVREGSI